MIISTYSFASFDPETAQKVISRLSELSRKIGDNPPPGLLEGKLLRENSGESPGQALLMISWASNLGLQRFLESEIGQELARSFAELVGNKGEAKDYFVTWQTEQPWSGRPSCNTPAASGKDWS